MSESRIRLSILTKLTVLLALTVIVAGGAIGWAGTYFTGKILTDLIHEELATLAHERVARLSSYSHQKVQEVQLVSSRTQLRRLLELHSRSAIDPETFRQRSQQILRDARRDMPDFLAIRITDGAGRVVTATDDEALGQDYSHLEEFRVGRERVQLGMPGGTPEAPRG